MNTEDPFVSCPSDGSYDPGAVGGRGAGGLLAAIAIVPFLAGCAGTIPSLLEQPGDARFGEANRQTMMAQVIDPDPVYEEPMTTSGEHAAQAVERYRTDEVKQPDSIRTTDVGEGGSGGS